jgi:hypothetical protein
MNEQDRAEVQQMIAAALAAERESLGYALGPRIAKFARTGNFEDLSPPPPAPPAPEPEPRVTRPLHTDQAPEAAPVPGDLPVRIRWRRPGSSEPEEIDGIRNPTLLAQAPETIHQVRGLFEHELELVAERLRVPDGERVAPAFDGVRQRDVRVTGSGTFLVLSSARGGELTLGPYRIADGGLVRDALARFKSAG